MVNFILALMKVNSSGVTAEIDPVKIWFKEYYREAIALLIVGFILGIIVTIATRFLIEFFRENRDIPEDDKKEDE